jgi:hypothetical protein
MLQFAVQRKGLEQIDQELRWVTDYASGDTGSMEELNIVTTV